MSTSERPSETAESAQHWDEVDEITELLHEERFHEALTSLRTLIQASPTNPYAYHYLGVALYEVGEIAPARSAYMACLKVAPAHLGARIALSHVERTLGNYRDAVREAMTALSQAPGDADALHAVGLAYIGRGDRVAARRYLEAYLEARPEFEAATEVRAILASLDTPMS
jgi:Flp pilus assembly protein TadD